jgi:hypothetical protein
MKQQQKDDIGEAQDKLIEAVRHFLIKLIGFHANMAARAALALNRVREGVLERHSKQIEELMRRVEALENNDRRRG